MLIVFPAHVVGMVYGGVDCPSFMVLCIVFPLVFFIVIPFIFHCIFPSLSGTPVVL